MSGVDPLEEALRARTSDPREAERLRIKQDQERGLSAPEKRGIARLVTKIAAWIARLLG